MLGVTCILKAIISELRVKHYVKNLFVFLPLVFSLNLLNGPLFLASFLAFLGFCFGSSAVYVVNDILDADADRLHPKKKLRPVAAGTITPGFAWGMAAVCLAAAGLSILPAGRNAAMLLGLYIAVNAAYSLVLKRYALLDVFCLMSGFILRIQTGAAAAGVAVSDWLLLTVMALSLMLGFGKRLGEIKQVPGDGTAGRTRKALASYTEAFLDRSVYATLALTVAFYALWAIDRETAAHLGTTGLVWTVPLAAAGLFRYAQLVGGGSSDGDPTNVVFSDIPIRIIIAVYIAAVVVMIYFI